ncbi:unannotated protein [freshwater metagenome]|uniref:Unannotated protein n=1 Tax=freshwater metagenome TaxID=449393 RepID=A0A6J7QD68_9ZZZZ
MNSLRLSHPWFARGESKYDVVAADHDDVYAVLRESADGSGLLLVNLSDHPVTASVDLQSDADADADAAGSASHRCAEVLTGAVDSVWRLDDGQWRTVVELAAFEATAFDVGPLRRP